MGLDIITYTNARLVQAVEADAVNWEALEDASEPRSWIGNSDWPEYMDGNPNGVYRFELGHDFRAGSYSGYGAFREALCRFALNVEPEIVWANPEKYRGKPFFELINHSDCEGALGPETCMKLHGDFEAWRDSAMENLEDYYFQRYQDWAKAFDEAAGNGFVVFH